jgi:hypothetical protein
MAERVRLQRRSATPPEEEQGAPVTILPPRPSVGLRNGYRRVVPPDEVEEVIEEEQPEKPVEIQEPKPVLVLQKFVDDHNIGVLIPALMESLAVKQGLVICRLGENKWKLTLADGEVAQVASTKMVGTAYWKEVLNPEYVEWQEMWKPLSASDKELLCRKVRATWKDSKSPTINAMRMADAYRVKVGIEKYKSQYRLEKQRAAIRA